MTTQEVNHVFIYVLDRVDDPFYGINLSLQGSDACSKITRLRMSREDFALIKKVEYGWRRYMRIVYYRKIFRKLEQQILASIQKGKLNVLYMADEGIWGVFLAKVARSCGAKIVTVNVQHGYFDLDDRLSSREKLVRKTLNSVSTLVFGYPSFGFGFGASGFNLYLCYGHSELKFLKEIGNRYVYVAPRLIKQGLVEKYNSIDADLSSSNTTATFFLPACVPGSGFGVSFPDYMQDIGPLVRRMAEVGWQVVLKVHPGMDRDRALRDISNANLLSLVQINEVDDLAYIFKSSSVVFSARSTALFEAEVLGLVAVSVSTAGFSRKPHFVSKNVDLNEPQWEAALDLFLEEAATLGVGAADVIQELDWPATLANYVELESEQATNCLAVTVRADFGGGPEHIYQLARKAEPGKLNYFIACPNEEPYWQRYSALLEGKLFQIPHRKINIPSIFGLARFAVENRITLIHTHGKGAGLIGRVLSLLTGLPCVHTPHGIHTGEYNFFTKRMYILYERLTTFWVKHVIFVSNAEREAAKSLDLWPNTSSSVIYNGVVEVDKDQQRKDRQEMRAELGIEDQFCVSTLSRFDYAKNMQEAYEISKRLPRIQFLWVGDGEDRESLESQAKREGVTNIIFIGTTRQPEKYLAASDSYFSTSRWEGLSLGILEAMANSLPVVASNVVGNNETVIPDETGYLYEPGVPESACEYIQSLSQSEECRTKMSKAALEYQEQEFSVSRMAKEVSVLYDTLL